MKKLLLSAFVLSIGTMAMAQKPEKNKVEGYYNNIPKQVLNISGLSYEHKAGISKTFDEKITDKHDLSIDGFGSGNDIKLVLTSTEPVITTRVAEETKTSADNTRTTTYTALIEARANTKVLILDKNNQLINYFDVIPDYKWVDKDGFDRSSFTAANEELKGLNTASNRAKCKSDYVSMAVKAAQQKLNEDYGKGVFTKKFRVYTIKAKKFDYTDFNDATNAFISAFSTAEINSEANKKAIDNAIVVWQNYESQYLEGKKSKVCDVNIDEIYMNLAVGYLVKGDGENLKKYWQKCLDYKGNHTAEGYFKFVAPRLIDNYDYYLAKGKDDLTPIDKRTLISETEVFNNKVFLQGIFSTYLSSKVNLLYPEELFAPNSLYLGKAEKEIIYKHEDLSQKLTCLYGPFGKISNVTLSTKMAAGVDSEGLLAKCDLVKSDSTLTYSFVYKNNRIESILLNNKTTLFKLRYCDEGYISGISYYGMYKRAVTYGINRPDETGKIDINLALINRSTTDVMERQKASITFDDNELIKDIRIAPYTTKKRVRVLENGHMVYKTIGVMPLSSHGIEHDESGNVTKFTYYDFADNPKEVIVTNEVDEHGNAIKSSTDIKEVNTSYTYIF
ncbi:hypothetical protein [Labilibacter marinus]|uniref:hypothetical protein n=1 Tax=Labilibacter marinus TaxID=1477105 RepID=UPI00094FE2C6|nr:hypothetical protein [Labilibacter marinus]